MSFLFRDNIVVAVKHGDAAVFLNAVCKLEFRIGDRFDAAEGVKMLGTYRGYNAHRRLGDVAVSRNVAFALSSHFAYEHLGLRTRNFLTVMTMPIGVL